MYRLGRVINRKTLCAVFLCFVAAWAVNPSDRLLENFVRAPLVAAPSISGDGHFISALVRAEDGRSDIAVWRVDKGFETRETLPYERLEVDWMAWVGGGRLLMSLKEKGLVLYDAHIGRLRPLIDEGGPKPDELPPLLLSSLPDDPTNILMQWEDPGTPGYPAVYRVNAIDGTSEKVVSAWKPIIRWWAAPSGSVTLGEGYKGRKQQLYAREALDRGWYRISNRDYFDGPAYSVLSVEAGGGTALVLAPHDSDTRALWRMDIETGNMMMKLAGHGLYDMRAALIDPVNDMAVGVIYFADKPIDLYWQASRRDEIDALAKRVGEASLTLVTASREGHRLLLRALSVYKPVTYYLYDRETDSLTPLPEDEGVGRLPKPQVEGVFIDVPGMKQKMHAILSHPEGGPTGKAVVLVHGGPVSRVVAQYQPLVSLLTAYGYSVLQPNFRGSSGYGETWRRAGYGEWGRHMQDDVRTAADWLVENGISSPGQMCVAGGSYGGYAALLSAVRDDDMFVCAISLNGVTSLPHLVAFLEGNRFHDLTVPRIKERLSGRTLHRRSPLQRVDMIGTPVLILHATEDTNVPFYHSTLLVDALEAEGKDYEYIVLEGAEHVLRRESERRTYYRALLKFLQKHLP